MPTCIRCKRVGSPAAAASWLLVRQVPPGNDGIVERFDPDRSEYYMHTRGSWIGLCPNCQVVNEYVITGTYRLVIVAGNDQEARKKFVFKQYDPIDIELGEDCDIRVMK